MRKIPAIISRHKPGDFFSLQWLKRNEALFAACEWEWADSREGAHIFPDVSDAEALAPSLRWEDEAGHSHSAWVLIVSIPHPRHEPAPRYHHHPSPQEVFEELERRHLA
jgi:hypothetical protein